MFVMIEKSRSKLYRKISKGDARTHACLRKLVVAAGMVDPTCPDRPISPLLDIIELGLSPRQINTLYYRILRQNPFMMSAILYASNEERKIVKRDDLLKAIQTKGRNLNMARIVTRLRQADPFFGRYYSPKSQ